MPSRIPSVAKWVVNRLVEFCMDGFYDVAYKRRHSGI